jgi:uncharacterized protein YjiS (DUF1127 family)
MTTLTLQQPLTLQATKIVKNVTIIIKRWIRNSHTRSQLGNLTTAQLNDIGLTQAQAYTEANKAFWE